MRCSEVIHELALPSEDRDTNALAAHLAACQPCAQWAQRDAELTSLWEATRPDSPSPAAWGLVWSQVSQSLEHATVSEPATRDYKVQRAPSHRRRLARFGLIVLAQAAAVFFMVGVMWRSTPSANPVPQIALIHPTHPDALSGVQETFFEIDEGPVVLIRVEAGSQEVVQLVSDRVESGVDDMYLLYNELESLATSPVVAMQE